MRIIKKWVIVLGASLVVLSILMCVLLIGPPKKEIMIYDNSDNLVVTTKNFSDLKQNINAAYLDVVINEAIEIIQEVESCSINDAKKKLLSGGYNIYTNLDSQLSKKINDIFAKSQKDFDIGMAITNLEGDLLATVGYSKTPNTNLCTQKRQPCSALKPLAVYAPAIEKKTIVWSSLFNDSPYSQIKGENGILRDWPANSTGTYSDLDTTVCDAFKLSLNTVAVKCLSKYGVKNSIEFLENSFNINLDYERDQAQNLGENEIIGNIALGSTAVGCSTIDMAGYYQIFANGGSYIEPKAIVKICDSEGKVVFESKKTAKQVIKPETSQIVNSLLQKVVTSPDGTGKNAFCKNVPVAGKTGTGDNKIDNWFVGVTPEYSCAVWHSQSNKNYCPEIFADVIGTIEHEIKLFSTSKDVSKKIYCLQSGKLATKNCKTFDMGYYENDVNLDFCDIHN